LLFLDTVIKMSKSWLHLLQNNCSYLRLQNHVLEVPLSITETLAPVAFLVSVHHLRPRAGLVGPASV